MPRCGRWKRCCRGRRYATGYCLGGILLATAAAALARNGETKRLRSLTLLATELDFTEPGELMPFIHESQVAYIEDLMWDQGYLDGKQFAGAFHLLRSNDLIWSRLREYLRGERQGMTDLMAWNAGATRVPYAMQSEVLRSLFLKNDLAEGRYRVDGQPAVLGDLRLPVFCVATTKDHVAPWRSVFKNANGWSVTNLKFIRWKVISFLRRVVATKVVCGACSVKP